MKGPTKLWLIAIVTCFICLSSNLFAVEVVEGELITDLAPNYYQYNSCYLTSYDAKYFIDKRFSYCYYTHDVDCNTSVGGNGQPITVCTPEMNEHCFYHTERYDLGDTLYDTNYRIYFRSQTGDVEVGYWRKSWFSWRLYIYTNVFNIECGDGYARAVLK